jgi:hypothetical protein
MSAVGEGILWLYDIGFFTSLLPFVLIYTIVYAIMQKTGILGQPNYDALFSFALAFFTIFRIDIVENFPIFIARVMILFFLLLAVMLISGMLGIHETYSNKFLFVIVGLYLVYITIDTFMGTEALTAFLAQIPIELIFGAVIVLGVFMALVTFITSGDSSDSTTRSSKPASKKSESPRRESKPIDGSDSPKEQQAPQRPQRNKDQYPVRKNVDADDFDVNEGETKTLDDIRREYG